jgi:hypothetical protein
VESVKFFSPPRHQEHEGAPRRRQKAIHRRGRGERESVTIGNAWETIQREESVLTGKVRREAVSQLTLISSSERSLKPLVEAALANELRSLEAAIRITEQHVGEFETKYGMQTIEFISRFENDEIDESADTDDWIGEYRLLERLREKAEALKGIEFAN